MPKEIVRRCSCCDKAITPRKGRGRPSLYCEECAPKSKQQKNKLRDIAKANRALAVLDHLTKRHNSLRIRGEIDEKVLFATLYAEIRKNPKCLPTDMRRALTRYIDPEYRKPKDSIPTFGTYFGRFCNEFRGLRVSNLVKLYPKPEEIKKFIDLEEATKAQFDGVFPYSPSTEYSAIELLLEGYEIDDSVIEDEDAPITSSEVIAFENVDRDDPADTNEIQNAEPEYDDRYTFDEDNIPDPKPPVNGNIDPLDFKLAVLKYVNSIWKDRGYRFTYYLTKRMSFSPEDAELYRDAIDAEGSVPAFYAKLEDEFGPIYGVRIDKEEICNLAA